MVRRAALLPILWIGGACGRFSFDELRTGDAPAGDAPVDVAPDAASLVPCDWSAGPPFTSAAVRRADLSMVDTEYDPFLVQGDPLTINYVSRDLGSGDLLEARRPSVTDLFATPMIRTDLSTASEESALALDRGGLHGYYVSNVSGDTWIYEVSRPSLAAPLAIVRKLTELGTTGSRLDPWPFADGLGLAYLEQQPAMPNRIWLASRATTTDLWTTFVEAPYRMTFANTSGATLTANGLVLVFSANGTNGQDDIFYATRVSLTDPFEGPFLLTAASSPDGDHEPSLRDDGCELFLSRDTGSGTKWDIYSVPAVDP